jgi:hypothetical protein
MEVQDSLTNYRNVLFFNCILVSTSFISSISLSIVTSIAIIKGAPMTKKSASQVLNATSLLIPSFNCISFI